MNKRKQRKLYAEINFIINYISEECEIGVRDIQSDTRAKHIAQVRHVIVWASRLLTSATWSNISKALSRTDHSTAINSYRRALMLRHQSTHHRLCMDRFISHLREELRKRPLDV